MNNVDLLKDICEDIYEITRIKAVIYDGEMNNIYAHPLSMGEFCSEIRKHKQLAKKCIECDKKGFSECRKKGDIYIYDSRFTLLYKYLSPDKDHVPFSKLLKFR